MKRGILLVASVAAVCGLFAAITVAEDTEHARAEKLARELIGSAQTAAQGSPAKGALSAAQSTAEYWLPALGENLPEWAKRFEFEWDIQEDSKPDFSLLTVQPLFQSEDARDTVFTQLRGALNHQFGDRRITGNAGLGYRRLLFGNRVLVGVNTFLDYEFDFNHSRASVGGEVRWAGLDFYANNYWSLSRLHSADSAAFEEPLDGHDLELTAQLPYLPWARVRGRKFWWDTVNASEDIKGWSASVEMDLHANLQVEAGVKDTNFIENEAFVMLRFRLASANRPTAFSNPVAGRAWEMRDMRAHTLDKVRRENKIILERSAGGVVITRGN